MNSKKIGGIAGILEALLYLVGILILLLVLSPALEQITGDTGKLSYMLEHKTLFQIWHILIYVVFGLVLIPLTIAINDQFKTTLFVASKVTPVLGFIWSGMVIASGMIHNIGLESLSKLFVQDPLQALTIWKSIGIVQNGLGGGVEIVGGVWVLLISLSGLREHVFPTGLNYLGIVVGLSGTLTIVPGLHDLGMVFGLTQIIWFAWIGIYLMRDARS